LHIPFLEYLNSLEKRNLEVVNNIKSARVEAFVDLIEHALYIEGVI
jgi:hypothetical protein|tara:strand:- start:190 stop:327 length:138 start_codon:yes stop_codon:yes gene_type:complete